MSLQEKAGFGRVTALVKDLAAEAIVEVEENSRVEL
jgi:hypothetical protein